MNWNDVAAGGLNSFMDFGLNNIQANSANVKSKRSSLRELWINKWLMDQQNEYNKPVNQMKRLSEAGLNPNLVYGSGASTLSATAGHISRDNITPSSGRLDVIEKMSMLNAMRQQEANIDGTRANTNLVNTNIDIQKAQLDIKRAIASSEIRRNNADTALKLEEVENRKLPWYMRLGKRIVRYLRDNSDISSYMRNNQ
ncbi:DNA pilot protein [Sigmofec virus UA08Rod_6997]|uniref:DNA pilot protein n=1 Tax=Sigmofec virus UA08Rod_6997 TaxID=2929243 RepID=A0A976N090_9VIRU|nr:DNA pilot protein [Sigmofec virus UA08Rod_6997]